MQVILRMRSGRTQSDCRISNYLLSYLHFPKETRRQRAFFVSQRCNRPTALKHVLVSYVCVCCEDVVAIATTAVRLLWRRPATDDAHAAECP